MHPWVQKFYLDLGLESGERLLWHFQTPVLYWINFSLRSLKMMAVQGLGALPGPNFSSRDSLAILTNFLWGDPEGCLSSTAKSSLEVPAKGDFGEEILIG